MRTAVLTLIYSFLATNLLFSQTVADSDKSDKSKSRNNQNKGIKTQKASPVIPSVDELLEKSKEGNVEADSMWVVIDHAKGRGVTCIDIQSNGSCWVIEKTNLKGLATTPYVVKYSPILANAMGKKLLSLASRKDILFADNKSFSKASKNAEKVKIGVSSNNGRSVHTSPLIPFSDYPESFRENLALVMQSARTMPLSREAMGVVSSEFVNPTQSRRLTVLQGQKLIAVKDPGKNAKVLSAIIAASRMPGRKVVVTDPEEWLKVITYLNYNKAGSGTREGRFLISVGKQTYRIFVEKTMRSE